jgi:Ser/Thr protein kinase RdoA (MazF antagonist)
MDPLARENNWTAPPALLRSVLQEASCDPDSCECRVLTVDAHESQIIEVRVNPICKASKQFHAILKLYNDPGTARSREDAKILAALRERGVKVPAVLGTVADHNGILLEWFGSRTFADMLKAQDAGAQGIWEQAVAELAGLHGALNQLWGDRADIPRWGFSREQRRSWAIEGLASWLSWLPAGSAADSLGCLQSSIEDLVERLVKPEASEDVIWGDCNPKNILVHEGDIRLIDFQLKRASRMMDLVLLLTFADSPSTYLARTQAHRLLNCYWRVDPIGGSLETFLRSYDDELLWRILVYGGMLLRKRDKRLKDWREVCSKMAGDLPELVWRQAQGG